MLGSPPPLHPSSRAPPRRLRSVSLMVSTYFFSLIATTRCTLGLTPGVLGVSPLSTALRGLLPSHPLCGASASLMHFVAFTLPRMSSLSATTRGLSTGTIVLLSLLPFFLPLHRPPVWLCLSSSTCRLSTRTSMSLCRGVMPLPLTTLAVASPSATLRSAPRIAAGASPRATYTTPRPGPSSATWLILLFPVRDRRPPA